MPADEFLSIIFCRWMLACGDRLFFYSIIYNLYHTGLKQLRHRIHSFAINLRD
jgi:hypothetical protein